MAKVSIDKDVFLRRIQRLYSAWKGNEESSTLNIDAIVSIVGQDEDIIYSKSTALQQWLFGYELTDTVIVLCDSGMYFLSSKKKIEFLKPIQDGQKQMENIPPIHLLLRNKGDNDAANFKELVDGIKKSKEGKNVGVFVKDKFSGDFSDAWKAAFQEAKFEKTDISPQLAYIMSVKEESEVALIKKASYVTSMLFDKFFKQQVVKVVDEEKSIKHSKLADQIEQALEGMYLFHEVGCRSIALHESHGCPLICERVFRVTKDSPTFVRSSIRTEFFSETNHRMSLIFCMKLVLGKSKKVSPNLKNKFIWPKFWQIGPKFAQIRGFWSIIQV